MYSSHLKFILHALSYRLNGLTAVTELQEQCNNRQTLLFLRLMVCTEHTQLQELHLKNQLRRSYNKFIINRKSCKRIIKVFVFNKVFTKLDHSKVFVQYISMNIKDNLGEYSTNAFIYISCNILHMFSVMLLSFS